MARHRLKRRGSHVRLRYARNALRVELEEVRDAASVRNAATLYGTTIVTSFLGFFYWFIAAHLAPASAVGTASAVQSAAVFFAIFGVLGISTLTLSEVANDASNARTVILTGLVLVAVFSMSIAVVGAIVLRATSRSLHSGLRTPLEVLIFAALVAFSTMLLVTDDACIGLLRGDLQLRRNTVFAVAKLAALPLFLWLIPYHSGMEMVLAWLFGLIMSFLVVMRSLSSLTPEQRWRVDVPFILSKRRLISAHHWLNVSIWSPPVIIPVMVAITISTAANAAFTAAILMVSIINIIPYHLSTVLFALAPGDEDALRREVPRTMRICLVVSLVAAPVYFLVSHLALSIFGSAYTVATTAMIILALTNYPQAIKHHYVAIARVRGRMGTVSFFTIIGGVLEVGLATIGGIQHGLTGVALGFLAGLLIETAFFAPTVFRVRPLPKEPVATPPSEPST